jgi:thiamine-phosphate pyrophosphorylase
LKSVRESLLLYAVTDRAWLGGGSLAAQVEEAILGGATFVQLREKELPVEEFLAEALKMKEITDRYGVPFVINDNIEVALACGADGVHVGQDDRTASEARAMLGEDKILGVSVQTLEQAVQAERDGADYLGVGAVFSTSTKTDAVEVPYDVLKEICASVSLPVVAIGGIGEHNILELRGCGIAGVAVISALFSKPGIRVAAQRLNGLARQVINA